MLKTSLTMQFLLFNNWNLRDNKKNKKMRLNSKKEII